MTSSRSKFVAVVLVVLTAVTVPVVADAGGPVLDYLEDVLTPIVNSIQATVNSLKATSPELIVLNTQFTSTPGGSTEKNIDFTADLPVDRTKRYTVTMTWGALTFAPPGTAMVEVVTCVPIGPGLVGQVPVAQFDPAGRSGTSVPIFAGTNSFVRVTRGSDGLGPREIFLTAYMEVQPE